MGWRNLSDTSEVITTLLEESMRGAAAAVKRSPLPVGFSLATPVTTCTRCGDVVRAKMVYPPGPAQLGDSRWAFPVDEQGRCNHCVFVEGAK